jgi:hypothetical protein
VIVELEADGIHFWCSSPAVTRKLLEKGARIIAAGQRAEDPGFELAAPAMPPEEPAPEGPQA